MHFAMIDRPHLVIEQPLVQWAIFTPLHCVTHKLLTLVVNMHSPMIAAETLPHQPTKVIAKQDVNVLIKQSPRTEKVNEHALFRHLPTNISQSYPQTLWNLADNPFLTNGYIPKRHRLSTTCGDRTVLDFPTPRPSPALDSLPTSHDASA